MNEIIIISVIIGLVILTARKNKKDSQMYYNRIEYMKKKYRARK